MLASTYSRDEPGPKRFTIGTKDNEQLITDGDLYFSISEKILT